MRTFLIGFMGSGKSTVGRLLAARLNFRFVDLDAFIEEGEGTTIPEIFDEHGEDHFRLTEQKYLHSLGKESDLVIAAGGGTPCFFDNMKWINEHGVSVYLKTSAEELYNRLRSEKEHRPLLSGRSDEEMLKLIQDLLEYRDPFYRKASFTVKTKGSTPETVARTIFSLIRPQ